MGISEFQFREMLARTQKKRAPDDSKGVEDETNLQNDIAEECRRRGWICFRGSMAHRTHRTIGEPDCIVATDDGRTIYVEAKSKRGKLTPAQNAIVAWLEHNKQRVVVVKTLAQFVAFADGLEP